MVKTREAQQTYHPGIYAFCSLVEVSQTIYDGITAKNGFGIFYVIFASVTALVVISRLNFFLNVMGQ